MKVKLLSCSIFFICTILFSCQKDDLMYSCNEHVNAMVKSNMADIKSLTRSKWLDDTKMSYEYKIAAFRAFNHTQKFDFINSKINEAYAFDWNNKELEHINKLKTFLSKNTALLENNWQENQELLDKYELFQYMWVDYAQNELKWSKETIFAIAVSPGKILSKSGSLQEILVVDNELSTPTVKSYNESDDQATCFCDEKFDYCKAGDPAMWFMLCVYGNCKVTSFGCQLLLLGECRGFCRSIVD